jgi:leader peptidase (prepilin peptidase)/N-methyltransferase
LTVLACLLGAATAVRGAAWLDSPWWLLPLLPWAATLAVAAVIDARELRVPTGVIRCGALITVVGLGAAAAATARFTPLLVGVAASAAAFAIMLACWRFADAGFGDVRLAALGGLGPGLGAARYLGIAVAVAVTSLLIASGAARARRGAHNPGARFALGPALVAGFFVAILI